MQNLPICKTVSVETPTQHSIYDNNKSNLVSVLYEDIKPSEFQPFLNHKILTTIPVKLSSQLSYEATTGRAGRF